MQVLTTAPPPLSPLPTGAHPWDWVVPVVPVVQVVDLWLQYAAATLVQARWRGLLTRRAHPKHERRAERPSMLFEQLEQLRKFVPPDPGRWFTALFTRVPPALARCWPPPAEAAVPFRAREIVGEIAGESFKPHSLGLSAVSGARCDVLSTGTASGSALEGSCSSARAVSLDAGDEALLWKEDGLWNQRQSEAIRGNQRQ